MSQFISKKAIKTLLFFFVLTITALTFGSKEAEAVNRFNGDVVDAEGFFRLDPPDVDVSCGSGCSIDYWVDMHFDATHGGVGNGFTVNLTNYPSSYESCSYEITDRGPDIDDTSDYTVIDTGESCDTSFTPAYSNDWRYGIRFLLHPPLPPSTPTPVGCKGPLMEQPEIVCDVNNDGTASVRWNWESIIGTIRYRLQIALNNSFTSIERDEVLGASPPSYYIDDVGDPETIRYARVKVEETELYPTFPGNCPGGFWNWSNTVISVKSCQGPDPDLDDFPKIPLLETFFCNADGRPTDEADTGKIISAIGCIPVDNMQAFTRFMLTWGIALGGGISFFMAIYAGFLYMTSGENPKKVQAARELATASVGGLFYLLFAAFMFRIIGLDILNIPGL